MNPLEAHRKNDAPLFRPREQQEKYRTGNSLGSVVCHWGSPTVTDLRLAVLQVHLWRAFSYSSSVAHIVVPVALTSLLNPTKRPVRPPVPPTNWARVRQSSFSPSPGWWLIPGSVAKIHTHVRWPTPITEPISRLYPRSITGAGEGQTRRHARMAQLGCDARWGGSECVRADPSSYTAPPSSLDIGMGSRINRLMTGDGGWWLRRGESGTSSVVYSLR